MKDEFGRLRTGVPTMYVAAPIRDANFQVVAALALRIRPEREFTRILQLGRVGESGETFAIDKKGTLVSNSRFDDELILLGLLPDADNSHSILNISGPRSGRQHDSRASGPACGGRVAADQGSRRRPVAGTSGVDVEGYRDYRGVPTVGAWEWLPKYDMGIITEVDYAEAFRPLTILQRAFYVAVRAARAQLGRDLRLHAGRRPLQREAQKAAIEAKQLGPISAGDKLGAGAMGVVYQGAPRDAAAADRDQDAQRR